MCDITPPIGKIMNYSIAFGQKWLALVKYSPLIYLYKINVNVSANINQSMQKSLTENESNWEHSARY